MKTHILVIVFNRFRASEPLRYVEVINSGADESCEIVELKRKPRARRFDEVRETGEGSYNHWNAHRASRLHRHPLLKR